MFTLFDGKEVFTVNEKQQIGRAEKYRVTPSDKWKAIAIVRFHNNGSVAEEIPFNKWDEFLKSNPEMYFKNGKMKYSLVDYDHGTRRIWGNRIRLQKQH